MISTIHFRLFVSLVVFVAIPKLNAEDVSKGTAPVVVELADLGPDHDGKEVTMVFKITDTQLIGGEREGEYPHVKLHYAGMKAAPYLAIYAKGDLADALHRFALVSPNDKFVGRSIRTSGKIKVLKGADQIPVYILDLHEWKKFQILPESKVE